MVKPKRNKSGMFQKWPGGKTKKGSHRKFKKNLKTRKEGRYVTKGGKTRVRTQMGIIYEKQKNGSYKRVN